MLVWYSVKNNFATPSFYCDIDIRGSHLKGKKNITKKKKKKNKKKKKEKKKTEKKSIVGKVSIHDYRTNAPFS